MKVRFTDEWVPLPEGAVDWKEGDELEVEVVDADTLLIHRVPTPPITKPRSAKRGGAAESRK